MGDGFLFYTMSTVPVGRTSCDWAHIPDAFEGSRAMDSERSRSTARTAVEFQIGICMEIAKRSYKRTRLRYKAISKRTFTFRCLNASDGQYESIFQKIDFWIDPNSLTFLRIDSILQIVDSLLSHYQATDTGADYNCAYDAQQTKAPTVMTMIQQIIYGQFTMNQFQK